MPAAAGLRVRAALKGGSQLPEPEGRDRPRGEGLSSLAPSPARGFRVIRFGFRPGTLSCSRNNGEPRDCVLAQRGREPYIGNHRVSAERLGLAAIDAPD